MLVLIKIKWKPLIISIAIPLLLIGGASALLTMNSMEKYKEINRPALSPPGWIFPVVWTILFILMGIASYIIYESDSPNKAKALTIYVVQLLLNLSWSLVFFNLDQYWISVAIIIALDILIALNIAFFGSISKVAAFLLLPYMIWALFATYLNISIAMLN